MLTLVTNSREYKNIAVKTDQAERLHELTRQIAAREHKRVTLSDTLRLLLNHYEHDGPVKAS